MRSPQTTFSSFKVCYLHDYYLNRGVFYSISLQLLSSFSCGSYLLVRRWRNFENTNLLSPKLIWCFLFLGSLNIGKLKLNAASVLHKNKNAPNWSCSLVESEPFRSQTVMNAPDTTALYAFGKLILIIEERKTFRRTILGFSHSNLFLFSNFISRPCTRQRWKCRTESFLKIVLGKMRRKV